MMDRPDILFNFAGVMLLAAWLLKTSLGTTALDHAPVRRINLSPWMIVPVLLFWQGPSALIMALMNPVFKTLAQWQVQLLSNIIMTVGALGAAAGFGILGWFTYARRLKGLGLGLGHLRRDFWQAAVTLFTVMPVILALIVGIQYIGQQTQGPEYQIEKHEELKILTDNPQVSLKISVAVVAVLAAPLVEELLFRGLIQTLIRSYVGGPWISIFLTSIFFAIIHDKMTHWPALFVLSVAMGYVYEKSGSLWQSIFIHALFNGMSVVSFL